MMLLQRQQKAFGSRLAAEVTMNTTLGRRTGIHGVVQASAVRLKDVKVMNDGFHGDLLNQLVSGFIKQTKNNQITNDVVSKQVHRLGQLVHATELVGGRNIIRNGVVLFHNILLAVAFRQNDIQKPVDIIGTADFTAGASEIKGNDVLTTNATLNHKSLAILHVKQGSVLFDGAKFGIGKISNQFGFSMDTGSRRHNILQKRINHLDSISQHHRMIRSNLC